MDEIATTNKPNRITDLVNLKKLGYDIIINSSFDIIPVNFAHKNYEFQAYIFLCKFSGNINQTRFSFRKCYARGCPHNLCPHVSQAVMIANRYLKRDYKILVDAGISIEQKLFNLEDMMVKYEGMYLEKNKITGDILTIHDYINLAKKGNSVDVKINLEIIPAVEHFANQSNKQSFLMADFNITALGKVSQFQKCFSCFPTENETREKAVAINTANDRLKFLFTEFDDAMVQYKTCFFN